jgi:hypothetical protein
MKKAFTLKKKKKGFFEKRKREREELKWQLKNKKRKL